MGNTIVILDRPLPVRTPLGPGWLFYIKDSGMFENDEFTVVLDKGGEVRHFGSDQVQVWHNATYGINKLMTVEEILNGPVSNQPY